MQHILTANQAKFESETNKFFNENVSQESDGLALNKDGTLLRVPKSQQPPPDLEHIKELAEVGHVDIVTARELSTDNFVKNWLKLHGVKYENYVSVIDGTMKADLDYDLFIDDSPLNAEKFQKNKKNFLIYSQPWNMHISTSKRISSLSEASSIIHSKF